MDLGVKKTQAIADGVAKSKTRPYRSVLVSLGIPDFGRKAVDLLVSSGIRSIDDLLSLVDADDQQPLLAIKGFGEKTVSSLFESLRDDAMRQRIKRLRAVGLHFSEEEKLPDAIPPQVFAGQTWCVTGGFKNFIPRSLALVAIEARGGRTTGSVTGKTTHLLVGEGAGSKLEQAKRLGVIVVGEDEFMKKLALAEGEDDHA